MIELTNDYRTGITTIDNEHKHLVQIINELDSTLQQDRIDIQILAKELFDNLSDYAKTHFSHEEEYMRNIDDPELPRQQQEHEAFLQKLKEFPIDDSVKVRDLQEMVEFLVRWLFRHILNSDMMIGKNVPDDPFAFTNKYKTGIPSIDNEHKTLFDIVRKVNDIVLDITLHDKYDKITEILDHLREYTLGHFQHEEEYMESIHYPGLKEQQRAHQAFADKLVNLDINDLDDIDNNQQTYLLELIDYLLNWLSDHILKADLQIAVWERQQNGEKK